ncbi:hypothetical protein [Nocardia shimofusensis]|uniref:hypothetical protein n=1 Tax=Nocardia shimofusensis TaxID=228596 RepID=UPI000AF04BF7|nr:hypothetical protein [Nocardia shimofusensis]
MPPYPKASWVSESWWAPTAADRTTTRRKLAVLWSKAAAAPKPRHKEFVDELKGWSGQLGDGREWARAKYGPLAAFLARTDSAQDEPAGWLAVSRMYADYGDPLARFTAGFAAAAHEYRPRGLPHRLGDSVKCYELQVPPTVRAAMVREHGGVGTGGVLDSAAAADDFVADPERHHDDYRALAMRRYASVLLEKMADFADDPRARAAFTEQIAALAVFGDPEQPPRAPLPEEHARAEQLLGVQIRADPRLREDPDLPEAYLRARRTLLRWQVEGRELVDARIIYRKLRSARLDAGRAEQRVARSEVPIDAELLSVHADLAIEPAGYREVRDAQILSRARACLSEYRAPSPDGSGDCWEKSLALGVLAAPGELLPASADPAELVRTAWKQGCDRTGAARPEGAVSASVEAAARLVDALLFLAVGQVTQVRDRPELYRGAEAARRTALRHAEAEATLEGQGFTEGVPW